MHTLGVSIPLLSVASSFFRFTLSVSSVGVGVSVLSHETRGGEEERIMGEAISKQA